MTYVLGSLGAAPRTPDFMTSAILQGTGIAAAALIPQIKAGLLAVPGASNWQIYNFVRFNDANISSANAAKKADKQDYTPIFKQYRNVVNAALQKANIKGQLANALRFQTYGIIDSQRTEMLKSGLIQPAASKADPGSDDGDADTASKKPDNTLFYVAGAAAVALVAFGAMRRKS